MTDKQWYLYCIENDISFLLAHENFRREFYEVVCLLNSIRDDLIKIFRIDKLYMCLASKINKENK